MSQKVHALRSAGGFNFVSSVKDQSFCGSCVAFAAMGVAESTAAAVMKKNADVFDFSGFLTPAARACAGRALLPRLPNCHGACGFTDAY